MERARQRGPSADRPEAGGPQLSRSGGRATPPGRPRYRPREFLLALPERIRRELPEERRGFEWQQRFALLKLWYGDPRLHYEVWFHRRIGRLEVGLHFESDPATNRRLLAHFDENLIVAKAELSERVEAEPWDRGWARVYEMLPLEELDEPFLERVAARAARFVTVLGPLLDEVQPLC